MLATKLSAPTAAARAQSHDFLARLEQAERRDESVKLEVRDDRRTRRRSDPGRGRRRSEVEAAMARRDSGSGDSSLRPRRRSRRRSESDGSDAKQDKGSRRRSRSDAVRPKATPLPTAAPAAAPPPESPSIGKRLVRGLERMASFGSFSSSFKLSPAQSPTAGPTAKASPFLRGREAAPGDGRVTFDELVRYRQRQIDFAERMRNFRL